MLDIFAVFLIGISLLFIWLWEDSVHSDYEKEREQEDRNEDL